MHGLTRTAITATEKHTLMLGSKNHDKVNGAWSRSRACLKSMSRTITMQGLTLTAITASEIYTLMLDST